MGQELRPCPGVSLLPVSTIIPGDNRDGANVIPNPVHTGRRQAEIDRTQGRRILDSPASLRPVGGGGGRTARGAGRTARDRTNRLGTPARRGAGVRGAARRGARGARAVRRRVAGAAAGAAHGMVVRAVLLLRQVPRLATGRGPGCAAHRRRPRRHRPGPRPRLPLLPLLGLRQRQ